MTDGAAIAARVADAIEAAGQTVILRRLTGTTNQTAIALSLPAVVAGYQPHELADGIVQGDQRVTISNRDIAARHWPGPPRKGDQVDIEGKTTVVQGVDTTRLGDAVVKHVIQVRG